MRAVRLHAIGGPENLVVEQIDAPVAGDGEILIKLSYAAFNRRDVFITQGLYPGIVLPVLPGSDGCGVVVAHGAGASGPPVGATVVIDPMLGWGDDPALPRADSSILGMPHAGTFAEYVTVPAQNVHVKPERLSDAQAAAIPLAGLTAYRAVFTRGRCTADDVVLIPGVGGGVQTFALQFAKAAGARVVTYGGTTGDANVRMFSIFWKHLDILGTSMGTPADFAAMLERFAATDMLPAIDEIVPLADVVAAAQRVASGEQFGKVLLHIAG
jgi:NADPH:quinone reductase-like Zn-dependent oxidoreductase